MTTGEIDLAASEAGVPTPVLMGCEIPLIVTRRFLLGDGFAADAGAQVRGNECRGASPAWKKGDCRKLVTGDCHSLPPP